LWALGPLAIPKAAGDAGLAADCVRWGDGIGPGMMGRGGAAACSGWGEQSGMESAEALSGMLSIEHAHEAVERYIATLGDVSLKVAEVMEFERNFYAIVEESDTGIGALELLVDKWTGAVGPEMGPNMMWNGRYGMHGRGGRMMGRANERNRIAPQEALQIAQRWLGTHRAGVKAEEHADPFYGYYTIHTVKEGQIEGMLSVHGTTGQVWYHTWHGAFLRMIEGEGH